MLRFGVLGAGRIGKVHARTIAASGKAKVAYLADAMPKAAEDLAAEVGASVASVEDIIKASDVDAILIATPTPFHAEQIDTVKGDRALCGFVNPAENIEDGCLARTVGPDQPTDVTLLHIEGEPRQSNNATKLDCDAVNFQQVHQRSLSQRPER